MKNIKKVLTVALAICFAGGNILTAPVWTFAAEHDVRTEIKDNIETVQEAEESPTLQDPENLKSEEVASITEDQALDPELVESCIYQISAVKARCNYLIRAIKARSSEGLAAAGVEGGAAWT